MILEAFIWFDPGPLVKQITVAALPDSGRGSYPVAYQICRQPAHALVPGRTWMIRGLHICPEPVQNPSGVCQGYETEKPLTLTASAWGKPQTATQRGFRLMPVSHSVKVWSKCRRPPWYKPHDHAVAPMVTQSYLEDPITLLLILDFAAEGTFQDGRSDTVQNVLHSCIRCIRWRIKHYRR